MIKIKLMGRMGNQMFQYSTCRSISEKNNCNYFMYYNGATESELTALSRFNLPMGQINKPTVFNLNSVYCEKYLHVNKKLPIEYLNIKDNTELVGYFQQPEFFDFNYENIKKWFDVSNLVDYNLYLEKIKKYENYCFIHIRGTDFIDCNINKLPITYYNNAMNIISNISNDIKFVIVTDDIKYSQELFPNIEIISNEDSLIDFKLLQSCKYLISSNSTFSWWAGYLNSNVNKIIYPYGGLNYGIDTHSFSKCNKFDYIKN